MRAPSGRLGGARVHDPPSRTTSSRTPVPAGRLSTTILHRGRNARWLPAGGKRENPRPLEESRASGNRRAELGVAEDRPVGPAALQPVRALGEADAIGRSRQPRGIRLRLRRCLHRQRHGAHSIRGDRLAPERLAVLDERAVEAGPMRDERPCQFELPTGGLVLRTGLALEPGQRLIDRRRVRAPRARPAGPADRRRRPAQGGSPALPASPSGRARAAPRCGWSAVPRDCARPDRAREWRPRAAPRAPASPAHGAVAAGRCAARRCWPPSSAGPAPRTSAARPPLARSDQWRRAAASAASATAREIEGIVCSSSAVQMSGQR